MPQNSRGRLEEQQLEVNAKLAHWTMMLGIFTIVLAAATIVSAGFIWWQSYTAWKVAREASMQALAAIQVTGYQPILGPDRDTGEVKTGFMTSFQNFGGSRAVSVSAWGSIAYYDGGVPNNTDLTKPQTAVENSTYGKSWVRTALWLLPL